MYTQRVTPTVVSRLSWFCFCKSGHWWLTVLLWFAAILPAQALNLRVAIAQKVNQVRIGSSTEGIVRDSQGQALGKIATLGSFQAVARSGQVTLGDRFKASQIWIEPDRDGYVWIDDRWYRGRTLLVPDQTGLTAINYVDLEEYLYSVLGGEMNGNWPQETLKAQAVAARSYALHKRQKSGGKHFDVGDTTTWQVYHGISHESSGTIAAVEATAGQVLIYNGRIIEAVFHSSSGGHTENVENVWTQYLPYLRGVVDYDHSAPVFSWSKVVSADELGQRLPGVGKVQAMTPIKTSPHGRVIKMKVVGDRGQRVMSGNEIRKVLGLRSTRFTIATKSQGVATGVKAQGAPAVFRLDGYGFGHGLGMSQWGAHNLALNGHNYQQILAHYYQNTTLSRVQTR